MPLGRKQRKSQSKKGGRGKRLAMKKAGCSCEQPAFREFWSGRSDSNTRPLAPHASTLPDCATPRQTYSITASFPETQIRGAGCVLFPVAPTPCLAGSGQGTRGWAGRSPQRPRKCRRQTGDQALMSPGGSPQCSTEAPPTVLPTEGGGALGMGVPCSGRGVGWRRWAVDGA